MNRVELAREAVKASARLRSKNEIPLIEGLCPYDLGKRLGISIRFVALSSLEGMYSPNPKPAIILGSERPAGRRRYSCAHELGHHVFGHGYSIDQLDDGSSSPDSPEEFLAQRFAGALLMPKIAIESAFSRRGWPINSVTPEQCFIVAQEFGVGFTTLVTHQELNLGQLKASQADRIRKTPLSQIRAKIVGGTVENDVFYVDEHWLRPTIDVEVGDTILFSKAPNVVGNCAFRIGQQGFRYLATAPGTALVKFLGSRAGLMLRVSRPGFTGLAHYRHLEEVTDE